MNSPEEFSKLEAEIRWLRHNQAGMDARLARVEDSMVFRVLRAIGRFYSSRTGTSRGYREWRARRGAVVGRSASADRVSLVMPIRNPRREWLERALASAPCEVIAIAGGEIPAWARGVLGTIAGSWNEAVERASGERIGVLGESDFLMPGAVETLASYDADVVYSDEEIVDESGEPVRPLFKPDWSPVLLRSVNYVGGLVLVKRGIEPDWEGLKKTRGRVVHVAEVLYARRGGGVREDGDRRAWPSGTRRVSIVICTRNAALIERCLAGLRVETEVVVVRHLGSSSAEEERAVAAVVERFGAKSIEYAAPFNFSEMNNRGAKAASGEILVFLNDDVEPLDADWLARLVGHLEDPGVGAVGAKLVYPDGAIQHAGIATWLINGAGHPGRNLHSSENWPWLQYTREVTAVTGACLAIRRADFERIGGFDPVFPVNFNDVDLCLRLRQEGFSVIVDTAAVLRHDESRTRRPGVSYEERRLFFLRWEHVVSQVDPYYSPHLAQNNEDLSLR